MKRCDLKTLLKMLFGEIPDVKITVPAHLEAPKAERIVEDTSECVLRWD